MAQNNKNKNWKQIMTSDEAYTYTTPKKKKSIWEKIMERKKPIKVKIQLFSKGGKVK